MYLGVFVCLCGCVCLCVCVCVGVCVGLGVCVWVAGCERVDEYKTNIVDEQDHSLLQRGMNHSFLFLRREYHYNGNWQKMTLKYS